MTESIWLLYNFVILRGIEIFIFSVMIAILYILFKRDQDKTDLEKEKTGKLDARMKVISKRLEGSLIQNKGSSEESNLEPTMTTKRVIPDEKNPHGLKEITEWKPTDMLDF